MAKVTIYTTAGFDLTRLDFSSIYDASSYTYGSSIFRANYYNGYADEFRGSGFNYNAFGEPVGGTVTSYSATYSGYRLFIVDGVKVPVTKIVTAAKTYQTNDDVAVIAEALKGKDTIIGGPGGDIVSGFAGNDTIRGGGGNDLLVGALGNDVLRGDAGNDMLVGGEGKDKLFGGAGSDIFTFLSVKDSTRKAMDVIGDFKRKQNDKIDLTMIDARSGTKTNDAFTFIGTKKFTGKKGELRYEKKGGNTYVYGDVNGDKKIDLAIQLKGAITLKHDDFIL